MNSKDSSLTENWIQVKDINNGMIFLDDKSIVSGVKISPRNIFILTEGEQNRIINSLKEFYNLIEYEFLIIKIKNTKHIFSHKFIFNTISKNK